MKRILLCSFISLAMAVSMAAQTMSDALEFSNTNYAGTARSMALGNAMTAVGGDLGAIVLNPAGSAVYNHGVISFTPGIVISGTSSAYSEDGEYFPSLSQESKSSRLSMPNLGVVAHIYTGQKHGLKRLSFSWISTQTDNYLMYDSVSGSTEMSSMAASRAANAWGLAEDEMASYSSFRNSNISWADLCAYQSRLIGSITSDTYIGNNELLADNGRYLYNYVPGILRQNSSTQKYGAKNDMIFNASANYNDRLFFGLSLGLPMARYRYMESFSEAAADPDRFPIEFNLDAYRNVMTYFKSNRSNYSYSANLNGIYGKIGLIALLSDNLRLGLAFQSPTAFIVDEAWKQSASSTYDDSDFNAYCESPIGEYSYTFTTPYIFNAGLALTFGQGGFISADYELADYSVMRFSDMDESYFDPVNDWFPKLNSTCRYFGGLSQSLRLGAEIKLGPEFALRAGYSVTSGRECYWVDDSGNTVYANDYLYNFEDYHNGRYVLKDKHTIGDAVKSFSFGFGYSSPGSFFADFAAKKTTYPMSSYLLYDDYNGYTPAGEELFIKAPGVRSERMLWNVSMTIGWRF